MELANLTPAELASANKADAAGVVIEARDSDGTLIDNPIVPAAIPTPAAGKTKPEGLPEKFWNATTGEADYAGLAKSYTELEKGRGKPAVEASAVPAAPAKSAAIVAAEAALAAAQAADPATIAARAAAEAPRSNAAQVQTSAVDAAAAEFATLGKLSDATYETLKATGLNRTMVDTYINGQALLAQAATAEAYGLTGGEDGYKSMTDWARVNLTPQQITEFDSGVANAGTAKLVVADLFGKYQAANGRDGNLVSGGNGSVAQTGGYANQSELIAAVSDPRYKKDTAYRASVEAKMGKTADNIL